MLEESKVQSNSKDEQMKGLKRRMHDFAKTHQHCERDKRELELKILRIEKDKQKVNEKWIRLSQRVKVGGGAGVL